MTELDLYKFIKDNDVEIDWRGEKLMAWIHPLDLHDFTEMVGDNYLSDGGFEAVITTGGYVCVELNDLCGYFGIELERILPKEEGVNRE